MAKLTNLPYVLEWKIVYGHFSSLVMSKIVDQSNCIVIKPTETYMKQLSDKLSNLSHDYHIGMRWL